MAGTVLDPFAYFNQALPSLSSYHFRLVPLSRGARNLPANNITHIGQPEVFRRRFGGVSRHCRYQTKTERLTYQNSAFVHVFRPCCLSDCRALRESFRPPGPSPTRQYKIAWPARRLVCRAASLTHPLFSATASSRRANCLSPSQHSSSCLASIEIQPFTPPVLEDLIREDDRLRTARPPWARHVWNP